MFVSTLFSYQPTIPIRYIYLNSVNPTGQYLDCFLCFQHFKQEHVQYKAFHLGCSPWLDFQKAESWHWGLTHTPLRALRAPSTCARLWEDGGISRLTVGSLCPGPPCAQEDRRSPSRMQRRAVQARRKLSVEGGNNGVEARGAGEGQRGGRLRSHREPRQS